MPLFPLERPSAKYRNSSLNEIGDPARPPSVWTRDGQALAGRAGVLDDRAEQLPALAVELHHLHLLVYALVGRGRIRDHAGQGEAADEVLQIRGLPHHVFTREIVAALTQDMHQQFRGPIAVG